MDNSGADSGDYLPLPQNPKGGGPSRGVGEADMCVTSIVALSVHLYKYLVSSSCRHYTIQTLKGNFKNHAITLNSLFLSLF